MANGSKWGDLSFQFHCLAFPSIRSGWWVLCFKLHISVLLWKCGNVMKLMAFLGHDSHTLDSPHDIFFVFWREHTHTYIYTVYIYICIYIHTYIYISHIPFFSGFSIYFPWDPIMIPSHDDPMKSSVGSQGGSLPLPRWGIGSSPEPRSEGAAVPWRVTRVTRVTTQKRNDEETSSTSKLSLVVLLVDFYQVQF